MADISSSEQVAKPSKHSLSSLPPEIRSLIYEHLFHGLMLALLPLVDTPPSSHDQDATLTEKTRREMSSLGILLVSKQYRADAHPHIYRHATIILDAIADDFTKLSQYTPLSSELKNIQYLDFAFLKPAPRRPDLDLDNFGTCLARLTNLNSLLFRVGSLWGGHIALDTCMDASLQMKPTTISSITSSYISSMHQQRDLIPMISKMPHHWDQRGRTFDIMMTGAVSSAIIRGTAMNASIRWSGWHDLNLLFEANTTRQKSVDLEEVTFRSQLNCTERFVFMIAEGFSHEQIQRFPPLALFASRYIKVAELLTASP